MTRTEGSAVRAVFWDNDGVLVDTETIYFAATRDVLATVGVELTHAIFVRFALREGRSAFDLAEERGLGPEEVERLRIERNRIYNARLAAGVPVFDGVVDTLQALHGKVRMAIVTTALRESFDLAHARSGLLRWFDFVLTREDYARSKPHPEPYLTAATRSGVAPAECLVVEDSERGLRAALAAGMRCLVVPHALTRDGDFRGAHAVLESARQVAPAVRALLCPDPVG